MHNSVKERLILFLETNKISKSDFGRKIGVSSAYVTSIRKSMDADKIQSIALNYPNLNIEWLLTGKGNMERDLRTSKEKLADRLSTIIWDLNQDSLESTAHSFGLSGGYELANFTNNFEWPQCPFDFVKFLKEFPEYNLEWILTGEGNKFALGEEQALRAISERRYRKRHPEFFPKEEQEKADENRENNLWDHIKNLDQLLKSKEEDIQKLLALLSK